MSTWKRRKQGEINIAVVNTHKIWDKIQKLLGERKHQDASKALDSLEFMVRERLGPAVADMVLVEEAEDGS